MWCRTAVVALAVMSSAIGAQPTRAGAPAPEIDLPALAGGRIQLSKLRGRPVVVSFWGTWCAPCREEFPELVRAHRADGSRGLQVIGVNGRDQEFNTKDVQKFVDEYSVTFPIALDQRGKTRQAYLVLGLPTTVFIDTAGVVQRVHRGPISRDDLDRGIALILPPR